MKSQIVQKKRITWLIVCLHLIFGCIGARAATTHADFASGAEVSRIKQK